MIVNDNQLYLTKLVGEIFLWYKNPCSINHNQFYLTKLVDEIFLWYKNPCSINDIS